MAIKLTHPDWVAWHEFIEDELKSGLSHTRLTAYRLNAAATSLTVPVKRLDDHQSSMPYVEFYLSDVMEGWDDERSGQPDYEGHTYTALGGNRLLDATEPLTERLVFAIQAYTQRYHEAVAIAQTIRRHFGVKDTLVVTWPKGSTSTYATPIRLSEFVIQRAESDREGNTDCFMVGWTLTLQSKTDRIEADQIQPAIQTVAADTNVQLGDETAGQGKEFSS